MAYSIIRFYVLFKNINHEQSNHFFRNEDRYNRWNAYNYTCQYHCIRCIQDSCSCGDRRSSQLCRIVCIKASHQEISQVTLSCLFKTPFQHSGVFSRNSCFISHPFSRNKTFLYVQITRTFKIHGYYLLNTVLLRAFFLSFAYNLRLLKIYSFKTCHYEPFFSSRSWLAFYFLNPRN
jgi:hypothetical protein